MNKRELTVLKAITASADRWGESVISMAELSQVTEYGRTSLSKSVALLAASGMLQVVRTKRNYGKLYYNKYKLIKSEHQQRM
jgi:predicted transcriptional regulator